MLISLKQSRILGMSAQLCRDLPLILPTAQNATPIPQCHQPLSPGCHCGAGLQLLSPALPSHGLWARLSWAQPLPSLIPREVSSIWGWCCLVSLAALVPAGMVKRAWLPIPAHADEVFSDSQGNSYHYHACMQTPALQTNKCRCFNLKVTLIPGGHFKKNILYEVSWTKNLFDFD